MLRIIGLLFRYGKFPRTTLWVCWLVALTSALGQASDKADASAAGSPKPAGNTNTTQASTGFPVSSYEIRGNSLLRESRIKQIVEQYQGTNVGIPEILKAASDLQLEYQIRGFPTANVTLPPQKITNGIVQIQVTEGLLAEITVKNNRYYSSNNVKRALPSLRTNTMLNSHVFQAELDKANGNRDRQIYPQIVPGKETNTSALVLEVKDRLPLHGRLEYNNLSTPNSPSDRINANVSYDNLWQLEHSIGFQYGFSPALFKDESVPGLPMYTLDAPSVANYSLFYRAPLSRERPVSEDLQQNPTAFGYNEATRRFVLPPGSGRPEISAYVSRSTTDLAIDGDRQTVIDTALLRIDQQSYTRNVTKDESAGTRITLPLGSLAGFRSVWSIGLDVKDHKGITLPTNNFYTTATITNQGQVIVTEDTTSIPGSVQELEYTYLPLSASWQGNRIDKLGVTMALMTVAFGTSAPFDRDVDFKKSSSLNASEQFFIGRVHLARDQKLFSGWRFLAGIDGQVASQPLVSLEQIGIGGSGSVRGYREGELYGDGGFFTQLELRSPAFGVSDSFDGRPISLGGTVSVFTDYGLVSHNEPAGRKPRAELWGTGIQISTYFGSHLDGKFILGWALIDSPYRQAGDLLATFVVGAKF